LGPEKRDHGYADEGRLQAGTKGKMDCSDGKEDV